jgi:hypothetical protein
LVFPLIGSGLLWIIKQQESIAEILPALCRTDDGHNGDEARLIYTGYAAIGLGQSIGVV